LVASRLARPSALDVEPVREEAEDSQPEGTPPSSAVKDTPQAAQLVDGEVEDGSPGEEEAEEDQVEDAAGEAAKRMRPPTQVEYQAVIAAGELKLREYVKPVIKKKQKVPRVVEETGEEREDVISNASDFLRLSMIDSENPNEVNFNYRKEKVTKAAFVGAYSEGAGSGDEQEDKRVTFRGPKSKITPGGGDDEGRPGEGFAGTLSRSAAALSEEEPSSKAHNSRLLTTQSRLEASQLMADAASQEQLSPSQAGGILGGNLQSEEPATISVRHQRETATGRIVLDPRGGQPADNATLQTRNQQSFSFPNLPGHPSHGGPDLVSSQDNASGKTAPRGGAMYAADAVFPYSSGTGTASQQLAAGEDDLEDLGGQDDADADLEAIEVPNSIKKMRKNKKSKEERLLRDRSKNVFRQLGPGKTGAEDFDK